MTILINNLTIYLNVYKGSIKHYGLLMHKHLFQFFRHLSYFSLYNYLFCFDEHAYPLLCGQSMSHRFQIQIMKNIFREVNINELLFCFAKEEMISHLLSDGITFILLLNMLSFNRASIIKIGLLIIFHFRLEFLKINLLSK